MAHEHQWVSTLIAFPHGGKDPNKTFCGICGVDKKDCENTKEQCSSKDARAEKFLNMKGVGTFCACMHKIIANELFVPRYDYSDVKHNEIIEAGPFRIEVKASNNELTASIGFTDDALSKMNIDPGCILQMYRLEAPINIDPNHYLSFVKGSFDQANEQDADSMEIFRDELPECYAEMMKSESYHNHKIVADKHGVIRWKADPFIKRLVKDCSLNDIVRGFYRLGNGKFALTHKELYRKMGYSLSGYWEVFYCDLNQDT